jgi:prepilin-type processing-associated H-X9-DG protein/prepilin-type N-terminal cleavage/methylation domain-containing protein
MNHCRSTELCKRSAFTLVELLVAVGVTGLLAAITIPAIQGVRATTRRTTCSTHLHNVGLAWESAADSDSYPTSQFPVPALWPLLPHLEQKPLYDALVARDPNRQETVVDVLVCPDDRVVVQTANIGQMSYYMNEGSLLRVPGGWNGFCTGRWRNTARSDFRDGLSNTAAMSERLVREYPSPPGTLLSEEEMLAEPLRYFFSTPRSYDSDASQTAAAIQMCRNELLGPRSTLGTNSNGYCPSLVGYDHMLTPNSRACYNAPPGDEWPELVLAPPTSYHSGGVNVAFLDGRVQFVSESIGEVPWHAMGSRNGHD